MAASCWPPVLVCRLAARPLLLLLLLLRLSLRPSPLLLLWPGRLLLCSPLPRSDDTCTCEVGVLSERQQVAAGPAANVVILSISLPVRPLSAPGIIVKLCWGPQRGAQQQKQVDTHKGRDGDG
jgi:hypothetical protein